MGYFSGKVLKGLYPFGKTSGKEQPIPMVVSADGNDVVAIGGDISSSSIETAIAKLEGGYSVAIGKASGGDFTAVYSAATKIACSAMPALHPVLIVEDIEKIDRVSSAGVTTTYLREDYAMVVDPIGAPTYVITVPGANFVNTDHFIVYTNVALIASPNYAEDTAHSSGSVGTMAMAVRNDAGTALADNGDYLPLVTDAYGDLRVKDRNLENLIKAEDDAHVSGDRGIQALAVRKDTAATIAAHDGDYSPAQVNATGSLRVTDETLDAVVSTDDTSTHATTTTKGLNMMAAAVPTDGSVDANDIGMVGMSVDRRLYVDAMGSVAHDSVDANRPVKIGGHARSTQRAAVAEGDRVDAVFNIYGEQIPANFDYTLLASRTKREDPDWAHNTAPASFLAVAITNAFVSQGEIAVDTYNHLTIGFALTIGTSTDVAIQIKGLMTSGGTEYILDPNEWTVRDTALAADGDYRTFARDVSENSSIEINTNNTWKYIKLYVKDAADGTGTYATEHCKSIQAS